MIESQELVRLLETARLAVAAAAEAARLHVRGELAVELKADRTPVTAADRSAEAAILRCIRARHPEHAISSEESGEIAGDPRARWYVDPIDGTRGFARGGIFWGPLVGFEYDGVVLAGALALPALGQSYWAARGLGSFRDGERLALSSIDRLEQATVSLGEPRHLLSPPHASWILPVVHAAAAARCYGDLAGCAMLLDGRADAWVEVGLAPWDIAPLAILVEEAGGRFTDLAGQRTIHSGHALASNGRLHDELLRRAARVT